MKVNKFRGVSDVNVIEGTNENFDNVYREAVSLQSIGKAFQAFEKISFLAQWGHAAAQFDLALMYYNGRGVKENRSLAFYWLNKSRFQGYKDADLFLKSKMCKLKNKSNL